MDERPNSTATPVRMHTILLLGAFFASGAAGLVHEIVWTRLFRLAIGHTAVSMAMVLTATMGGLAAGALVSGRAISRRGAPLVVFAAIECAIGGYGLALPVLIDAMQPVFDVLYRATTNDPLGYALGRFVLCVSVLGIPATLMGATLPVAVHGLARAPSRIGSLVGSVYGVNTLGAAVGAALAGFVLLPSLGTHTVLRIGSAINFSAGGLALGLYLRRARWTSNTSTEVSERRAPGSDGRRASAGRFTWVPIAVLVGYGLSGAVALVLETVWTRVLTLMIGSSVYAFSSILIAFILGLAMGSAACAGVADRIGQPIRALAVTIAGIGLSALAVVPLIAEFPLPVTAWLARLDGAFWPTQFVQLGLSFAVMWVPTALMGAALPLATRTLTSSTQAAAGALGRVYGVNALGGAIGAFVATWLLIPWLGLRGTIVAAAVVLGVVSTVLFALSGRGGVVRGALALAAVCAAAVVTPKWDSGWLSFGPFAQARRLSFEQTQSRAAIEQIHQSSEILYEKSGRETLVTVREFDSGDRVLYVGGKPDASTRDDLPTQILLAHIPLLLHPDPRSALVIGLASGITAGSAGLHALERLDVVEISGAVVEASRLFDAHNGRILEDPRVRLIVADGRDHLLRSHQHYDAIISEPSNPWIAGVADLFSVEFFALCRSRLNDGGVAAVWLESYAIDEDAFAGVVGGFASVFDRPTLWRTDLGDYLLVGSRDGGPVDFRSFEQRVADAPIAADLARAQVRGPIELLSHLVADSVGLEQFAGDAKIHTDDNGLLEFATPRAYSATPSDDQVLSALDRQPPSHLEFLRADMGAGASDKSAFSALAEKVRRLGIAKRQIRRAIVARAGSNTEAAFEALRVAAALAPDDPGLDAEYRIYRTSALRAAKQRRFADAIALYARAHVSPISDGRARRELALLLEADGDLDAIYALYSAALRTHPDDPAIAVNLGMVAHRLGREAIAVGHYENALAQDPDSLVALNNLSRIRSSSNDPSLRNPDHAVELAAHACELTGNRDPNALETLRVAYLAAGMRGEASGVVRDSSEAEEIGIRPSPPQ